MINAVQMLGAVGPEAIAALLDELPDYRVQRRMRAMIRRSDRGAHMMTGLALDCETTGLHHDRHKVIELAMQRFRADASGRIVDVGPSYRWLEDPGEPISEGITTLTGITSEAVAGRCICDAEATGLVLDADFVIAHNSTFDRPFVEKRLPLARGANWVCSMRDVDWRGLGFEGRTLSHLCGQMGWFYEAHRADADVTALLHLVDHVPTGRSTSILLEAVRTASAPGWIIEAHGAPFDAKDLLKARGYRWDSVRRLWWTEVTTADFDEEIGWAVLRVYRGEAKPRSRRIDWSSRYAAS